MDAAQLGALENLLAGDAGRCGLLLIHLRRRRALQARLGLAGQQALQVLLRDRIARLLRDGDQICAPGSAGEFAVLLPNLLSVGHAQMAAQRILREFEHPVEVDGHSVLINLAIGVALCPEHAVDAAGLSRSALLALDRAVLGGKRLEMAERSDLPGPQTEDLRHALLENQLGMVFQPQLDLRTGEVVAVEALARWHHPHWGDVAPEQFIRLAERAGLAGELTRWSLNAALRQHAQLRRRWPELACAFNLSPKSFGQTGLIEQILAALRLWDLPPRLLSLEVTETAVLEDPDYSGWMLGQLSAAGVEIALDDFGRGFSSFTYLRHFPVSELKIDQLFVNELASQKRDQQIVRSMIELSHQLGLRAVAEGVEEPCTLRLLTAMGCDRAQGYHIARPLAPEELHGHPCMESTGETV